MSAWFVLSGHADLFQHALLGTFVLLILVQLALIPTYAKLPFGLGFWALTFTAAASGTYGIHWLTASGAVLGGAWTIAILAAVTLLIGWIAVRSILVVTANHRKTALEPVAGR